MKNITTFYLISLITLITACRKDDKKPVVYHKDSDVETLYYNNPDGVNIVVLGDGFIKNDLSKSGAYDTQVKEVIDYLFTVAPFNQYKKSFNTYVVYAESADRDAGQSFDQYSNRTRFNAYFSSMNNRSLVVGNYDATYKYVEKALPLQKAHLIIMLVNDESYGGTGGSIAVVSSDRWAKYTLIHEVGHTFAALGDEYVEEEIANYYSSEMVPYLPNIDTTNNPLKTKWSHFLTLPQYTNMVGSFEGAYYRAAGYYRPERNSLMGSSAFANFNAPSREAIVRRIDEILGVPFDFDKFLKDDAGATQPVAVPLQIQGIQSPKNDFVNMKQRINQLYKKQVN